MTDELGLPFSAAVSCRRLELVSKGGSEGHGIAHMTTGHEQDGLLGLVGAVMV
jgi:hypothetical protein